MRRKLKEDTHRHERSIGIDKELIKAVELDCVSILLKRGHSKPLLEYDALFVRFIGKNFLAVTSGGELEVRVDERYIGKGIEPSFHAQVVKISGRRDHPDGEADIRLELLDILDEFGSRNPRHEKMFTVLFGLTSKRKPRLLSSGIESL